MTDTVFDDLAAEAVRLDGILGLLTQEQWLADSAVDGTDQEGVRTAGTYLMPTT